MSEEQQESAETQQQLDQPVVDTSAPDQETFFAEMRSEEGFAELDDDALREMYEGLYPGAGASDEPKAPEAETASLEAPPPLDLDGFGMMIDDKPVEDPRQLTAEDLLTKVKFSYKAMGQDQQRTLAEVIRNAQLGHLRANQLESVQRDLQQLSDRLTGQAGELSEYQQQAKTWDWVLQQAVAGNYEPMQQLADQYQKQLTSNQPEPSPESQQLEQIELERAGQQVLEQEIRPYLAQVAEHFGADAQELEQQVLQQLERIPAALMTVERVQQYLTRDLIAELEASPGKRTASAAAAAAAEQPNGAVSPEVAEMRKTIEQLQGQLAELTASQRLENAPPPSGGDGASSGSGNGSGDVPNFQAEDGSFDMAAYTEWLGSR